MLTWMAGGAGRSASGDLDIRRDFHFGARTYLSANIPVVQKAWEALQKVDVIGVKIGELPEKAITDAASQWRGILKNVKNLLEFSSAQGVQVGDDHIDSLGDIGLFQEFLAEIGIVDELLGHGIAHDGGIGGALKQGLHLKDDSVGESEKDRLDGLPESLRFPGDLFPAQELGGEGFDAGEGVGFIRQPFNKSYATDPVQDQIGLTVGLFTGGPDESSGSNFSGAILER